MHHHVHEIIMYMSMGIIMYMSIIMYIEIMHHHGHHIIERCIALPIPGIKRMSSAQ